MRKQSTGRVLGRIAAPALVLAAVSLSTVPAFAAQGSIDHVQEKDGKVQVLFSLKGNVSPDLESISVSLGSTSMPSTAVPASDAQDVLRRTTVLAMDVSDSMKGAKFQAAKAAADTFLDNAPDDLYVGLVTFAGSVKRVAEPTTDHDGLKKTIDGLELSLGTQLYAGVKEAVAATGKDGARSVLVLSDGADSTGTPIATALGGIRAGAVGDNQVKVDVVAIAQDPVDRAKLALMAKTGNGTVLDADDASQIEKLFQDEAQTLAQQVLVTASPPDSLRGKDGELRVSIHAGDEIYTDSTFVSLAGGSGVHEKPAALPTPANGLLVSKSAMYLGLAGAAVAAMFLIITAAGGLGPRRKDPIERSIEAYTRQGAKKIAAAQAPGHETSVTQTAVGAAARILENNKGLESALGNRLEAAGLQVKPAEWLLIHAGIAVGAGIVGLLLGSGSFLTMIVGLLLGGFVPWFYLGFKHKRRLKAFNAQLADTLQLMAGSLSAGLSLAQSADTVVREGTEPIAHEFRRALVEARLGVNIEDALSGIAERMNSKDFGWVVMAIKIQREVGGNLAELLNNVAETIREREYLERQVLSLSAEGRLSVWILGGLPPGFMAYLLIANPTYLKPLYTEKIGIVMLFVMVCLLMTGILWMKKLVKVEV